MHILRGLLRLGASPVFFAMAWLTYVLNKKAAMMPAMDMPGMEGMAMPDSGATILGVHLGAGVVAALGSWWLMYLLMAVFCLGPWLDIGKKA